MATDLGARAGLLSHGLGLLDDLGPRRERCAAASMPGQEKTAKHGRPNTDERRREDERVARFGSLVWLIPFWGVKKRRPDLVMALSIWCRCQICSDK